MSHVPQDEYKLAAQPTNEVLIEINELDDGKRLVTYRKFGKIHRFVRIACDANDLTHKVTKLINEENPNE